VARARGGWRRRARRSSCPRRLTRCTQPALRGAGEVQAEGGGASARRLIMLPLALLVLLLSASSASSHLQAAIQDGVLYSSIVDTGGDRAERVLIGLANLVAESTEKLPDAQLYINGGIRNDGLGRRAALPLAARPASSHFTASTGSRYGVPPTQRCPSCGRMTTSSGGPLRCACTATP